MPEFFSSDGPYLFQFLVIFLVILILLMGVVLLFRRVAGRGLSLSTRTAHRGRQPRLGIVDIYELDRQRQLILLRRDNVEHLLLVGGPNDVVVERNVLRGTRLPAENLAAENLAAESVVRPEPASDFDTDRDAHRAALAPPSFEMPVVVSPPMPGAAEGALEPEAARPPPLDPALFEPEAEPADRPQAPAKSRIGISQIGRILKRTPPPLVNARPDVASERGRSEETAEPPPAEDPPAGGPPVVPGGPARPVDPAVLSDMARQLETALRRQGSAVTPPPGPAPARPEPPPPSPPPQPEPKPDPIAAAMAASQAPSPPPPSPPPPQPAPKEPAPAPPPKPAEPAAPESKSGEAPSPPFTVEEIETEFARLLGRPLDKKG